MPYLAAAIAGSYLLPLAVLGTVGYFGYAEFKKRVAANDAAMQKFQESAGDPVSPADFGK